LKLLSNDSKLKKTGKKWKKRKKKTLLKLLFAEMLRMRALLSKRKGNNKVE
jgi:hypothetical protein